MAWKKKVDDNCSVEGEIVNCSVRVDHNITDCNDFKNKWKAQNLGVSRFQGVPAKIRIQ